MHHLLGVIYFNVRYLDARNLDNAVKHLLISKNRFSDTAPLLLMQIYRLQGDEKMAKFEIDMAKQHFESVLKRDPTSKLATFRWAEVRICRGFSGCVQDP